MHDLGTSDPPQAEAPPSVSQSLFREAMSCLPAGVAILTSCGDAGHCGITVSSLASATDSPPTLSFYIARSSFANRVIRANRQVAVNLVNAAQWDVASLFGGGAAKGTEKIFEPEQWILSPLRAPRLRTAALFLEGVATPSLEVGTHTLFLLRPTAVEWGSTPAGVYHRRGLHMLALAGSTL